MVNKITIGEVIEDQIKENNINKIKISKEVVNNYNNNKGFNNNNLNKVWKVEKFK